MTVRSIFLRLSVFLTTCLLAAGAYAEGNAAHGKVLSYTCDGCHGIANYKNAAPVYSVPKLGGQHAEYILSALNQYAAGERSHSTMHAQAASLSAQDRADIAAFLQGPAVAAPPVIGTPPAAVVEICEACHGKNGYSNVGMYPILAGQYQDYLEQALRDYKSGKRKNPIMSGMVSKLNDADIAAVAAFFANQHALCMSRDMRQHGQCK